MEGVGFMLIISLLFLWSGIMSAEHIPITTYTTPEGLAHNHINRIRQDSRGYMWFCTDGGLSRFDGYQFINYTTEDGLPHPWVNDLLETRDHTYWIATDGGVCRLNPNGHVTRPSAAGIASVLPASGNLRAAGAEPLFVVYHPDSQDDGNRVNALLEGPSGGIWCATYAGLYRFQQMGDKVTFEFVDVGLPRNAYLGQLVNNVALDDKGALWIAARHGLFRRLRNGRSEHYFVARGLGDNFVETVFQDHSGVWWIGTRGSGFCSLVRDPKPGRPITEACYSSADGLPGNDVRSIFQSSTGAFWIGTTGGLSKFDRGGPRFRNYTAANGLSTAVIYKVAEDRDGNLWMGTRDSGVMRFAVNGFVTYSAQDGFLTGNADAEIFEDLNGDLCVITAVGARAFIERFDGAKFVGTEIILPRADPRSAVHLRPGSFQDRSGEWWVTTNDGIYRFGKTGRIEDLGRLRPQFFYDVTHGFQGSSLDRIYPDKRGDIWIATEKYTKPDNYREYDLVRWERAANNLHHYLAGEGLTRLNQGVLTALREDDSGNLWMGFDRGGGLVRYRGRHFESFLSGKEALKGMIRNIFVDHTGRVWIASTEAGLGRIDNPSSDHPQLVRYTTADGLSSNEIRCITEDRLGRIYVGTNHGVDRIDATIGAPRVEPLRVQHYTWANGLAKGTVYFAFCDHRGTLWFVTNDGISRLIPDPDRGSLLPPTPTLITGLRIMGVPQPLSQLGETDVAGLQLPPSSNEFEVEFLSIDFRPGAEPRYQYMLEGINRHWSTPTDQRRVIYPSLAPGAYRFLVRAVSSDGRPGSRPAALSFIVLAPVWRRWWFISLEAALAVFVVYSLSRYRLVQLLAVERMRSRIATDLHDDIGSSLSQVAVLSEVVRQRIGESDPEINAFLSRIGVISRELVDSMSDIVWSINPAKDKLYFLTQRMREFANDVFMARNIQFEFRASNREHEIRIGAEARRQVFLVFKECVHNIIRHTTCTHVEIEVRVEGTILWVQVRDNGAGFEVITAVNGRGLASIRDRARGLGGRIAVSSDAPGTVVTLEVPLREDRRSKAADRQTPT